MRNLARLLHIFLVVVTLLAVPFVPASLSADTVTSTKYGLAPSVQEGNILQCFDWTYAQITAELQDIAEAGFTTVQTSPAQYPGGSGSWYWLYQPLGFYLPDEGPLGTKDELTELCTEAHELGMFVIVDVVANHLCGDHTNIQDDLKDSQYWHTYGSVSDWSDRYQITHGDIGMTDLATEIEYVQECVASYLKELLDCGVDGFRWDAAKHIDLPSEWSSNFWPAVTTELGQQTNLGNDPYHYGEILSAPADGDWTLFEEYAEYIDFTDDDYGNNVLSSFNSGSAYSSYCRLTSAEYIDDDNVVYWAESHDTYSNDGGSSKEVGTNIVDRAWAIVGSRNNIPALYFSRPFETDNDLITIAEKGSTHFTATEVAAVNHFHNATIGQADYFVYDSSSNVNAICREGGAVIVLGSGSNASVSVTNGGSYTTPGTYTDEISGNTFTVTSSTISGTVGSTGIAVFYTDSRPTISFDPEEGSFTSETLSITATLENATSGTITVGSTTYSLTSSSPTKTFTIGSDMDYGESIEISWTASSDEETVTGTETYTKKDPDAVIYVYYNNPNSWTSVYCYIYDDSDNAVASWPGETMTYNASLVLDAYPDVTGWWVYEVPDGFEYGYVMFNDGGSNQYPSANATGLELEGESMICYGTTWTSLTGTTTTSDDGITIYVWPQNDIAPAPHLYAWSDQTIDESFDDASAMSEQVTLGGKTFYYRNFDTSDNLSYVNIIFWNTLAELKEAYTNNIISSDGIDVYVVSSAQPYIYAWNSNNTSIVGSNTPIAMNSTSIAGIYYYSFSSSYSSLSVLITAAEGEWTNQTADISSLSSDTWIYYDPTNSTKSSNYSTSGSYKVQTEDIENLTASTYFWYGAATGYMQCGELERGIYPATETPYFCYLVNLDGWSSPYAYIWDDSSNNWSSSTWPGDQLTNTVDTYTYKGSDYDIYKWTYTGSLDDYPGYVIFSNSSSGTNQTDDLVFVNGGYYDNDGNLLGIDKAIFDQYSANANYDENDITVKFIRTLSPSYYNTFCSPIDLSADEVETYFGEDCELEKITSHNGTSAFLCYTVSEIDAGSPYLIKPAATVTNPEFEGISIDNVAAKTLSLGSYSVTGTYSPVALDPATEAFLSTDFVLTYPAASTNTMNGLRVYFTLPEGSDAAAIAMLFDEESSWLEGIEQISSTSEDASTEGYVYTLSGVRLGTTLQGLPKGIYIQNGQKFIVK